MARVGLGPIGKSDSRKRKNAEEKRSLNRHNFLKQSRWISSRNMWEGKQPLKYWKSRWLRQCFARKTLARWATREKLPQHNFSIGFVSFLPSCEAQHSRNIFSIENHVFYGEKRKIFVKNRRRAHDTMKAKTKGWKITQNIQHPCIHYKWSNRKNNNVVNVCTIVIYYFFVIFYFL